MDTSQGEPQKRKRRVNRKPPAATTNIGIRVTLPFFERLYLHAERLGLSFSAYTRMAITERMLRDDCRHGEVENHALIPITVATLGDGKRSPTP